MKVAGSEIFRRLLASSSSASRGIDRRVEAQADGGGPGKGVTLMGRPGDRPLGSIHLILQTKESASSKTRRDRRYHRARFAGSNYGDRSYSGPKSYRRATPLRCSPFEGCSVRIAGDPDDPRAGCESAGSPEKA
ncbi:hypothetical protein PUN28_010917 [Cardiocondyla obscurior]|uniref:Uncharacterized protein n=1 Tax=Cardiocondyla obscurior TaxID=286306 RepID=A0AAW2FJV9_9HYME